jgi:hypothetical protein
MVKKKFSACDMSSITNVTGSLVGDIENTVSGIGNYTAAFNAANVDKFTEGNLQLQKEQAEKEKEACIKKAEIAALNYNTYVYGSSYTANQQQEEAKNELSKLLETLNEEFLANYTSTDQNITSLSGTASSLNTVIELYNKSDTNKQYLKSTFGMEIESFVSSNEDVVKRKIYYQYNTNTRYTKVNRILLILYYIVMICVFYTMRSIKKSIFIGLFLLFFIYPFLRPILQYLFQYVVLLYRFIF